MWLVGPVIKTDFCDAGWHTTVPRFKGARTDHVRVETSSNCFRRKFPSFDPLQVTRSRPIVQRIRVGGITMKYKLLIYIYIYIHVISNSGTAA